MSSKLSATFGKMLRSAREAQGWTQADLAERIGMAVEAYGRLERGRVLPRATTLVALAPALGITVDQLLGIAEDGMGRPERVTAFGSAAGSTEMRRVLRRLQKLPPKAIRLLGMFLASLDQQR